MPGEIEAGIRRYLEGIAHAFDLEVTPYALPPVAVRVEKRMRRHLDCHA
jgi:hypothetical protein